ncbi:MAG: 50S ribosomal protein L3 [Candidatus Woesearchaeota archaeon]|jgi:large subunit ribosomal protein L3|nr:50S ribosomal protein L3 [Candidatus Woesearchaeota archaeon]MDP7324341.1 50S ribosomal protein L3 [Candidatus Woesearchaeota archaeon]MDP7457939.1 50S ribosomal protein L3 [Candidatus Woesearchaeota archaeon]
MPTTKNPRHGSMQFWPRKRAKRAYARVRSYAQAKEAKLLGFAGYKVGMTHVVAKDDRDNSLTKGQNIVIPTTIIECPPLKAASLRFYKTSSTGSRLVSEILSKNLDKTLSRKLVLPKKDLKKIEDVKDFDEVRVAVHTQPKMIGTGRKKPELFELAIGGKKDEQVAYAKELLGKEIKVSDIFSDGMYIDTHAITKSKGFQGPVKRFGVGILPKKSEKTKRGPGSLGPWVAHAHIQYRVAKAGQMGYHQRTEYNKQILKIEEDAQKVNPKGGFVNYGLVKSTAVLVHGSVGGSKKRLIRFNVPIRPTSTNQDFPQVTSISLSSQQG